MAELKPANYINELTLDDVRQNVKKLANPEDDKTLNPNETKDALPMEATNIIHQLMELIADAIELVLQIRNQDPNIHQDVGQQDYSYDSYRLWVVQLRQFEIDLKTIQNISQLFEISPKLFTYLINLIDVLH